MNYWMTLIDIVIRDINLVLFCIWLPYSAIESMAASATTELSSVQFS